MQVQQTQEQLEASLLLNNLLILSLEWAAWEVCQEWEWVVWTPQ